jgi:uncharacterized protein (DUF2141 family)
MLTSIPLLVALSSTASPGVTVHIEGVRSASGTLRCLLHNRADAFPGNDELALAKGEAPAAVGSVLIHFDVSAAGDYAVSCFHDENGNRKLDFNFLHIPKEGLAASNDAKGHLGPPIFADAKFHYAGVELPLTVHITY